MLSKIEKSEKKKRVMLIITNVCNLNCEYCFEHEKNVKVMSFDTSRTVIDEAFEDIKEYAGGIVEVFGGEPFLNFELIKQIYDYIKEKYPDQDITFETTTNGTMVHGELQDWLYERRNEFDIALSLDGPEKIHNMVRPMRSGEGSFSRIDKEFFLRTWPHCIAKMTVNERTLPFLSESLKYVESLGFTSKCSLAIGMRWNGTDNEKILTRELGKLVDYYLEDNNRRLCLLLSFDLRLLFYPYNPCYRYCGVGGYQMICYDHNGDKYPCQGFSPISIGKDSEKFKNLDENSFEISDDNPCKTCRFLRICNNCYSANYQASGNIQRQVSEQCLFNRLCMLASANIRYHRIMSKGLDNLTDDDRLILKAIQIIQEEVMNYGLK